MKINLKSIIQNLIASKYFKSICFFSLLFLIYFISIPFYVIHSEKKLIYININDIEKPQIALVFGAGLTDNNTQPDDVLKDRLDTTVELYSNKKISKILVSGDNSRKDYNEPEVMKNYLVSKGVPEDLIKEDFAGRRSYDTCIRAKEIWGIDEVLIITSGYHLYRTIYTCEALGIDSTGFSGSKHEYINENSYKLREVFAIHKMVIDLYFIKPQYIGGEMEDF